MKPATQSRIYFLRPFFGSTGSVYVYCFVSRCLQHALPTPTAAAPNTPSICNCGPFSSPGTTKNPHTLHQYHPSFYGPIGLFLIITNHSAWRHHHTHSKSTFTTIHSSSWRTANNMLLLLHINIAQQNIPNSTAAPTHHVSISKNILFFKIFKI